MLALANDLVRRGDAKLQAAGDKEARLSHLSLQVAQHGLYTGRTRTSLSLL